MRNKSRSIKCIVVILTVNVNQKALESVWALWVLGEGIIKNQSDYYLLLILLIHFLHYTVKADTCFDHDGVCPELTLRGSQHVKIHSRTLGYFLKILSLVSF